MREEPEEQFTSSPTSAAGPCRPDAPRGSGGDEPATEAVRQFVQHAEEVREYAAYLVSAKMDGLRAAARRAAVYTVMGVVGLIALATVIIVSLVLLLGGLGRALGALFPRAPWLGDVLVGVVFLGVTAAALTLVIARYRNRTRERTVNKYESRKARQRAIFGRDVSRAAEPEGRCGGAAE
jgi:hypothetical protein